MDIHIYIRKKYPSVRSRQYKAHCSGGIEVSNSVSVDNASSTPVSLLCHSLQKTIGDSKCIDKHDNITILRREDYYICICTYIPLKPKKNKRCLLL